jgi:asparagine synthetase B (glutamine-hydrolysing)
MIATSSLVALEPDARVRQAMRELPSGVVAGHLAGAVPRDGLPSGASAAVAEAIVVAGRRLRVPLHATDASGATLFSALPGRTVAVVAEPAALAGTPLSFLWFHGTLENRVGLASASGTSRARDDAALVAAAWSAGGPRCLGTIYGDYSVVAIERTGRIVAAATPGWNANAMLYASLRDGVFAWATHPALLLGRDVECNPEFFARWYRVARSVEHTPYRGVRRVSGGHFLALEPHAQSLETHRWWRPPVATLHLRSERDYERALRETLRASVERATAGHGRVAISLSAGIDSASVAVCCADLARAGKLDGVVALSLSSTDPVSDESPFAAEVAGHLGLAHHRIPIPAVTSLDDFVDHAARAGFPTGHTLLGGWHRALAQAAYDHGATVVLNGAGGEALIAEIEDVWQSTADGDPIELARTAAGAIAHVGPRALAKAGVTYLRRRRGAGLSGCHAWLRPRSNESDSLWRVPSPVRGIDGMVTMIPNGCESHDRVYLADLPTHDRAPYLDRRSLEFAYSVPHWLRLRRTSELVSKTLARNAFPEVSHAISKKGGRVSINGEIAQGWRALLYPQALRQLLVALPSSFDEVLDRDAALAAVDSIHDAQKILSVHELAATALWVEGMRRAGWVLT